MELLLHFSCYSFCNARVEAGKLIIPHRGSETFISTIGHLDGRIDLFQFKNSTKDCPSIVPLEKIVNGGPDNRALMDLCVMASTLAYENSKVVQNVVTLHWKAS